jgi:cytochrome oxidase assembly protein ShyY1
MTLNIKAILRLLPTFTNYQCSLAGLSWSWRWSPLSVFRVSRPVSQASIAHLTSYFASWWLIGITLTIVMAGLQLCNWQLHRAEQKASITAKLQHIQTQLPDVLMNSLAQQPTEHQTHQDTWGFIPVGLQLQLQPQYSFLWRNRLHQGQRGAHLVMAAQDITTLHTILLDWGWLPDAQVAQWQKRLDVWQQRPETLLPSLRARYSLTGRLQFVWQKPPLGVSMDQRAADNSAQPTNIDALNMLFPDWETLQQRAKQYGIRLSPIMMQVTQPAASQEMIPAPFDTLVREWPEFDAAIHKHYAYALQWLLLTLVAPIIAIRLARQPTRIASNTIPVDSID